MRSIIEFLQKDLEKKFVLLAGPRQVGKTTLAKEVLKRKGGQYYNWDLAEDREKILKKSFIHDGAAVLDELHKYERWKGLLKGVYDKYHEELKLLVTGSARLDIYRRGGDSLFGRYVLYHLHPLTVGELTRPDRIARPEDVRVERSWPANPSGNVFQDLIRWGGFPEPFYAGTEEAHRRWSIQRRELLVREDIRDLTQIHHLGLVEHLLLLLPERVGSPLSINSLREDLQVAYNTVRSWLQAFSRLYILFAITPFAAPLSRAIHKEQKIYLWDWSQIADEGDRFENLMASHLWKAVHTWRDLGWGDFDLHYVRDRDGRETDFCITRDRKPWLLVEAKLSETRPSPALTYFGAQLKVPSFQIIQKSGVAKQAGPHWVVSADRWLPQLP